MKVKLKDIASFSKGVQIKGADLLHDAKYVYLNGGIHPSGEWDEYNVDARTVTISEGGGGAHCYYLYDIKGNEKYLYYALKSQQDRLMALRSGACMPNIKKSDLGEFFFEYENNLKRQGEIVDRLDILENCISLAQEEVEKLDLLVKSRFVEMFGSSKINPKGWEIVPLESLARVGSSKRVFVEELRTMGIPFYRGTEIGALAEGKNIVPELYITEEHYQMLISANGKVNKGDLLMPSICPDGRIWLVNTAEPFYYKDGRVL